MHKDIVISHFGLPKDFVYYETHEKRPASMFNPVTAISFVRDHGKNKTTKELAIFVNDVKVDHFFDDFWRDLIIPQRDRSTNYNRLITNLPEQIQNFQGKVSIFSTGLVGKEYLIDESNFISVSPEEISRDNVSPKMQYPMDFSINFATDPMDEFLDYINASPDGSKFYVTICSELVVNKDRTVGLSRVYQRVLSVIAGDKSVYYTIESNIDRVCARLALGMLENFD
ncbi:hypothetical protein phiOC_p094 [Ochrobactrum phage vB_OspM_OC]|nr:hypothetical protein phiOC_p094 [Ochrobactrum phage vB_OspM_OC]